MIFNIIHSFMSRFFRIFTSINQKLISDMGDVIITVLGLWVFIKILKVIFGGWSKSDYQRDR